MTKEEKVWRSGSAGKMYPGREKKLRAEKEAEKTAAGDAPHRAKTDKPDEKDDAKKTDVKGKGKEDKGKAKDEKAKDDKGKVKVVKDANTQKDVVAPPEEIYRPSEVAMLEAEQRAMQRKQNLCKRRLPVVTKVHINTRPWQPPGPPEKPPKVMIDLPPLTLGKWVPPYRRRRKPPKKLPRAPLPEDIPPLPESSTLKKVWHHFVQVEPNKMMIRGTFGCNSKRYLGTSAGAQTGCIAFVCRGLLDDKTPAQLVKQDVDDVIEAGDRFYRQCSKSMKCYKGKPALELNQLLPEFYLHDARYTVQIEPAEKGVLCKHPDNLEAGPDLMQLMDKYVGKNYMFILTVNGDQHFLIWGHPPEAGGTNVKTICYIFNPHMMDEFGTYNPVGRGCESCGTGPYPGGGGAGAFLRYAGVTSFCLDFLANYANLKDASKPHPRPGITLTAIEVAAKYPVNRIPGYDLDLKTLKPHCQSEWDAFNINAMIDEKRYKHKWALASLSAESLAMSRKSSRGKVRNFMKKLPPEPPPPSLPVPPEKPPPPLTTDQLDQFKGEDFFLYCPRVDQHTYGRDDLIPFKEEREIVHSLYEMAEKAFKSSFEPLPDGKSVVRGTRHFASYRYYQKFKWYTGIACCVAALAMLRKHRARAWNEDTIDETCDVGWNLFRESLLERHGPVRRLVLGELKSPFSMRDKQYEHKERGIAVWGRLCSKDPKVLDICRGIEAFFKESDSGILQIPGEFETAIWYEGGRYFMYHPWPADRNGNRVSLQGGGKACLIAFPTIEGLCEHFMDNVRDMKRKPYSISDVGVWDLGQRPEPVNNMKAVGPNRWMIRGSFHEGDERFPEDHRDKQATPIAIAAIAMASLVNPAEWTPADVEETLMRGDMLYEKTMENLDRMGINLEQPPKASEENEGEEEETGPGTQGTLAAADVLPRFNISEYDCIETDIDDSAFSGVLSPEPGSGVMSLKDSLAALFVHNKAGVVTARGGSVAVWKDDDHLYFFDPHGCDEYGLPSDDPLAGACLIRMKNDVKELCDVIMGNLAPGTDDSFNISPVEILSAKLNPFLGAPEIQQEGKAFEWLQKKTATILMGPRGENSGLGKAAAKCHVPKEDLAGRTIALPMIAAFAAASEAIPPPGMHQDHMFNFLETGGEYYLNHVKNTGRKDFGIEDLTEKFEMGANTFTIQLGESTRLPLRLPDKPAEGGEEEEEGDAAGGILGEGEEPVEKLKEMKELLFKMWYDNTKHSTISLLLGDYHQLGLWMAPGGKVVAFDPAPTLAKGLLTPHRIKKGDELREQRIKDEKGGEGEEEAEDEGGGEEAQPEVEEYVPPESCPVLMIFASPQEFIDKLVMKGGLNPKQAIAPYWLYPVTVTNEMTTALKEKKPGAAPGTEEAGNEEDNEEDALVDPLSDEAMGKYFDRRSRTVASMRGAVAQNDHYFMSNPNRDNQDAAMSVMGIIVQRIEPYQFWKPSLVDGILKYGDRMYTLSLPNGKNPPRIQPEELINEMHVTNFNIKTEIQGDVVTGDFKAGNTGSLLNLKRGLKKFFDGGNEYAVICAKNYCVGVWKAKDEKAWVYWDPHPVGPQGKLSPASAAGVVLFSTLDELADTFKTNLAALCRPGTNKYSIASVKVFWEYSLVPQPVSPQGAIPDDGYEWKVLTAFVEVARGRSLLRGSSPIDADKFTRDALIASAPSAIIAACMAHLRRPPLWTRKTVDDIIYLGCNLLTKSVQGLGYEFRPGEDVLHPLQVPKKTVIGVNFIRYDLQSICTGRLETRHAKEMTLKSGLEKFFDNYTHGILWACPYAVAVWRVTGAPCYYLMDPHACGPSGLRTEPKDEPAACVQTFTSPKLMTHTYLQNYTTDQQFQKDFAIYAIRVVINRVKALGKADPPLVRPQKGLKPGTKVVPATSKVDFYGTLRKAAEEDRWHPPGDDTWVDVLRVMQEKDKAANKLKGIRNANGWLVLQDGTQFLSASHSMACKRFTTGSRGNQALACSVMAVAMSAIEEVCRWCNTTLDEILDSGDQLYQDSYLHYHPRRTTVLGIEQILRKFYTPGNCVCRVVVYRPRQTGPLNSDFTEQVRQFFREERAGVFVAYNGDFAVALFKTQRGFYMFDPADRDSYGRAVPRQLEGRARSCFSQFPTVAALCALLKSNIKPSSRPPRIDDDDNVRFDEKAPDNEKPKEEFNIYGMSVSSLRKLRAYEK